MLSSTTQSRGVTPQSRRYYLKQPELRERLSSPLGRRMALFHFPFSKTFFSSNSSAHSEKMRYPAALSLRTQPPQLPAIFAGELRFSRNPKISTRFNGRRLRTVGVVRAKAAATSDYYATLNVSRSASLQEIKAAYRNLARKVIEILKKPHSQSQHQRNFVLVLENWTRKLNFREGITFAMGKWRLAFLAFSKWKRKLCCNSRYNETCIVRYNKGKLTEFQRNFYDPHSRKMVYLTLTFRVVMTKMVPSCLSSNSRKRK